MAVINFGSINIDHVYQVDHFVQPGETLDTNDYQVLLGGKGANQSIALANAGIEVLHVGCINENDVQFKQAMIKQGINGRFIRCTEVPSGHAIIQVTPSGENAIFLFGHTSFSYPNAHSFFHLCIALYILIGHHNNNLPRYHLSGHFYNHL